MRPLSVSALTHWMLDNKKQLTIGLALGKMSRVQRGPSLPDDGELLDGLRIVPHDGAKLEELKQLIESFIRR